MHAASSPRRGKAALTETTPSRTADEADGAAQEYLDALPIAAVLIGSAPGAPPAIERANDHFRELARHDERLRSGLVADVPLLSAGQVGASLREFLSGAEPVLQFEQSDLVVRFARLSGSPAHPTRCLVSLLDRTDHRELHFAADNRRDPLTGLPTRPAFEERVVDVLGHPNFLEGSHALLTVALNSRAGDELVTAFARRLLAALRAGDLLARTGPGAFAILVRLDRGVLDAEELTDRITAVLAAPFRLSDAEMRADFSVRYTLLAAA